MLNSQSLDVSQIVIEKDDMVFTIKNKSEKAWFKFKFDLGDAQIFDQIIELINYKQNLFLFTVFTKLKEISINTNTTQNRHYENRRVMQNEICLIYNKLIQKHNLEPLKVFDYEKTIPAVRVAYDRDCFRIDSEMFSDTFSVYDLPRPAYLTPIQASVEKIKLVEKGVIKHFQIFYAMLLCMIEREIKPILLYADKKYLKDPILLQLKSEVDKQINKPIHELKNWIQQNEGIRGMKKISGWDLKNDGKFTQVAITKLLFEESTFIVTGVENGAVDYGKNPKTKIDYDVDIEIEYMKVKIPVQVWVREGELSRQISNSAPCIGEEFVGVPDVISKDGGTNINYGKAEDFSELVRKLNQIPSSGILLIISNPLPSDFGIILLKEWWCCQILDNKCVVIMRKNETTVYYKPGFNTEVAKKLAMALGSKKIALQTDSSFSICKNLTSEEIIELSQKLFADAHIPNVGGS